MNPLTIVIPFDPVHDIEPCLRPGFVTGLVDAFDLERLEEALHRRVIPGVGSPAHGDRHAPGGSQLPVSSTGILTALASSLRSRLFSASSSLTGRLGGMDVSAWAGGGPLRCLRTQL